MMICSSADRLPANCPAVRHVSPVCRAPTTPGGSAPRGTRPWETRKYRANKAREWREANPQKAREYVANAYRARRSNPEGWLSYTLAAAKRRAARKQLLSNITEKEIELPHCCPVLGVELCYGASRNDPNAASLDRIDPTRGYASGNVRVISLRANLLRNNCTDPAVFLALAADARRLFGG